ncbi:ornithine carbamoyltransferase [Pontibacter ummariensis]|uniref:N-succinylornithine carbamoyltransferase n=1 Tax=Pontibacter ummariensis TaxID=1610492 RepID=A0A239BUR9_9BACT|nr:acetylornithine carbamoyltransferase [Pontibacter ummariensis]PRY15608.1 ornithine carbamoyltransferase [Pontibacter ummariensis]SNS11650.1 ornithine carbamoyltransferase [Pontibacter ummariensis]
MKKFTSVQDVADLNGLVKEALHLKENPYQYKKLGENKTLGLIFLNPSLRTRLSTQKAALNLGMNVMVMNLDKEGWALETQDGAVMNGTTVEHIKEAAAVMGQYCDILGIRSFPKLQNREEDYSEDLLQQFISYSKAPIVSLESATRHPLQSLADLLTINENSPAGKRPKVVLTWAPHVKAIPQCVANSFAEWMGQADVDLVITHPEGYELSEEFTAGATVTTDQQEALERADFVYVKNWSSYQDYGKVLTDGKGWMLTDEKLEATHNAKVMHCLPVRRNVELSDEILDGACSLVLEQANNRTYAAQAVLKQMLESL